MKKLNKKSDMYFINKVVKFKPFNISKAHLIDEDCNEFIVTIKGLDVMYGYCGTHTLDIIDYDDFTSEKWDEMTTYIEYERAVII